MKHKLNAFLLITLSILLFFTFSCISPEYKHLNRGNNFYDNGKWNEAISEYTEALNVKTDLMQKGDLIRIYSNRAAAYNNIGEYDKAIADCDAAIKLDPEALFPYINRSFSHFYKQDYEEALTDCDTAIALRSYDASLYYHKAMIFKRLATKTGDKNYYNEVYSNLILAGQKSTDAKFNQMIQQEINVVSTLMSPQQ